MTAKANFLLKFKSFVSLGAVILLFNSCNSASNEKKEDTESLRKGTIHISADETFKPVIDSQVQVFESSYPEAKVIVHYKPEAECLKDFLVDSIKMVIATRGYTENEEQFIFDSLNVSASKLVVAKDAIAVIVHPGAPDSLFSMDEVKAVLLGTYP